MKKFDFSCPYCKTLCEAEEEWRGMETECPECKRTVRIPLSTENDYQAARAAFEKKALQKKLILCGLLLLIAGALFGTYAYRKHAAAQRRLEARRRAAEQRALEEKKRAEAQRILAEKIRKGNESISRELERADKCKTPQEAIAILEPLRTAYSWHPSAHKIRQKLEFFKVGAYIRQEILRAGDLRRPALQISVLDSVIIRYPLHPFTEEAKKMLSECKAQLRKAEEKRQAIMKKRLEEDRRYEAERLMNQRRIAEAERRIQDQRMKEYQERRENALREQRESNRRIAEKYQETVCRWCKGAGKRSSISSRRDCSFCHGTGIAHRHVNCRDFIRQNWNLVDEHERRKYWRKVRSHHRNHYRH